jgi:hypothetical protein
MEPQSESTGDVLRLRERKDMSALKEHLSERNVSISAFAREAGEYQQNVNALLRGSQVYLGEKRRARLRNAIVRLKLDQPTPAKSDDDSDAQAAEKPRVEPRIRRL